MRHLAHSDELADDEERLVEELADLGRLHLLDVLDFGIKLKCVEDFDTWLAGDIVTVSGRPVFDAGYISIPVMPHGE
eukprot:7412207-Karenia_brevis.AAC.1